MAPDAFASRPPLTVPEDGVPDGEVADGGDDEVADGGDDEQTTVESTDSFVAHVDVPIAGDTVTLRMWTKIWRQKS